MQYWNPFPLAQSLPTSSIGRLLNLDEFFRASLTAKADRIGLQLPGADGGRRDLTFGEIDARAGRVAAWLADRGFEKGDRLCVYLPNRLEFLDLFLACTRLGVVFVPMNVLYRERELRHIVGDAEPKAVVTDEEGATHLPPGLPVIPVDDIGAAATSAPSRRFPPLAAGDPALIIYTSGTTGTAKGAVLTHGNLIANGRTLTDFWRITDADRYLALLPLFHVHGLGNGVHCWLASGCTMRLELRFEQKTIARVLNEFRPTVFFGVPTMYVRMLDASVVSDADARAIGRDARLFVSGSAPLPAHIHQAFKAKFGHVVLERYGMSEALMIMSNPYEGERRAGSVGPPLPGVSARIVGEDGAPVADDTPGEVEIKSPHLFKEYWRRADATAAAFHDGWFKTGDVGVRSADGYYSLRGRKGDLIISGGFNIYPREIEELLLDNPGVREAAVIGAPDPVRGEVTVAYIVADDDIDVAALEEHCRKQLASFKIPRQFIRVESLPRTALGKVQKHLLPKP